MKWLFFSTITILPLLTITYLHSEENGRIDTFSTYVDSKGGITLPRNYRDKWEYLGAWVVPELPDGKKSDGYGFHDVFAQPGTTEAFKINDKIFPDGTVLIKEIRSIQSSPMTTGPKVLYADKEILWFVMIKDSKGRFPDNPNWGDGWGWALFLVEDPDKNVSTDYKKDCLGCHIPAKNTDWVYLQGYPTLK